MGAQLLHNWGRSDDIEDSLARVLARACRYTISSCGQGRAARWCAPPAPPPPSSQRVRFLLLLFPKQRTRPPHSTPPRQTIVTSPVLCLLAAWCLVENPSNSSEVLPRLMRGTLVQAKMGMRWCGCRRGSSERC